MYYLHIFKKENPIACIEGQFGTAHKISKRALKLMLNRNKITPVLYFKESTFCEVHPNPKPNKN